MEDADILLEALLVEGGDEYGKALAESVSRGSRPAVMTPKDSTLWMVGLQHGLVEGLHKGPTGWQLQVHFFTGRRMTLNTWDLVASPMAATSDPRSVVCPACQAMPGHGCTAPTSTGRRPVTWFHHSREDAVR